MTTDTRADSSDVGFPRRFGPYVLITTAGTGGMGHVYIALTPRGELCVVKRFGSTNMRLPAHLIEQNKTRFVREAEITKALDHPCIPKTYESVHDGAASYLVQEFVDGMTIDFLMGALSDHQESFSLPLATYVATRIAQALEYLHDFRGLGLIHRDLTSTNVMLSRDGDVKVIDFGIAKATTLSADNLTQPNLVVGKPLWTAPEVRGGSKPDRRTDLYALGLLYWYLLTGEDPTDHLDEDATKHLPAPSTFRPDIPPDLDALVLRAVDSHPRRRFQTASEFLAAVAPFMPSQFNGAPELAALVRRNDLSSAEEFFAKLVEGARPLLQDTSVTAFRKVPFWRRRWLLAIATTLLAVGTAFALAWLARKTTAPTQPEADNTNPSLPIAAPARMPAPATPLPPPPTETSTTPVPSHVTPGSPTASPSVPSHRAPSDTRPTLPKAATRLAPSTPAAAPDAQALFSSAKDAAAEGDKANALRLVNASLAASPTAPAYIFLARLSWSDKAAARDALEAALLLAPGDPTATKLLRALSRSE